MKRLWLGAGLLVALFILSLWSGLAMGDLHKELSSGMEQASQAALSGDLQAGAATAQEVKEQWQKYWKPVAIITDHEPMEEIDEIFAQTETYARAGQANAFAVGCARLARLLEAAGEAHTPMWWNLL
ncbi:MAG: DUF4363 family protein [Oscillospiraceae bacterium]|nr:DUF4363 family protein [Oscillospiraceae bacterium]